MQGLFHAVLHGDGSVVMQDVGATDILKNRGIPAEFIEHLFVLLFQVSFILFP